MSASQEMCDKNYGLENELSNIIKQEKISACMLDYINKQSKSYSKIAQENLYNLMQNFDGIISYLYGKNVPDNISYANKLEILASVQCELYYKMGVLK